MDSDNDDSGYFSESTDIDDTDSDTESDIDDTDSDTESDIDDTNRVLFIIEYCIYGLVQLYR
jgi:hypothetical protein